MRLSCSIRLNSVAYKLYNLFAFAPILIFQILNKVQLLLKFCLKLLKPGLPLGFHFIKTRLPFAFHFLEPGLPFGIQFLNLIRPFGITSLIQPFIEHI